MTEEQRGYPQKLSALGKDADVLALISSEFGKNGDQAFCSPNNGFLAFGRRLVPSDQNRIWLRSPDRCTEFGTDGMIGMLEWMGRQVAHEYSDPRYSGTHLVVGDVSAPRGGCLAGPSGKRGHKSHTNGQDVDLGFLVASAGRESPLNFHQQFDPKTNWWLAKQILKNPYACVKVVFLDKRLIPKLGKGAYASGDGELWEKYRRFFRHMPGHKNHFHVRVGDWPGDPGCVPDATPELETEEDQDWDYGEGDEDFFVPDPEVVKASAAPARSLSSSQRPNVQQ